MFTQSLEMFRHIKVFLSFCIVPITWYAGHELKVTRWTEQALPYFWHSPDNVDLVPTASFQISREVEFRLLWSTEMLQILVIWFLQNFMPITDDCISNCVCTHIPINKSHISISALAWMQRVWMNGIIKIYPNKF